MDARAAGLDILRLGAVVLVTMQHAFTLTNRDAWTDIGAVNIGELGVAVFLGISASLGSASGRTPVDWLVRRLIRVYPAFWIALIISFALTWLSGYKSFTAAQVLSQLIGTGYFTHAGNLINVPTWFISLLFVGYLGMFLGKATGHPRLVQGFLAAAFLTWAAAAGYRPAWMHLATFFAVSVIATIPRRTPRTLCLMAGGVLLVALSAMESAFIYAGVVLILLAASGVRAPAPRILQVAADHSYEYYLIHGPALVGMLSVFTPHPVLGVMLGVVLAAGLAAPLKHAASLVVGRAGR